MVLIQFYPLDVTYKIVKDKTVVYIYGRTKTGKRICLTDDSLEPYFYVLPKEDLTLDSIREKIEELVVQKKGYTAKVVRTEIVKKKYYEKEISVIKVITNIPRAVPAISYEIKQKEFCEKNFEYDVVFTRRYLVDKQIVPLVLTDVEAEQITEKSRVSMFKLSQISQKSSDTYETPKMLGFDIETYNPKGVGINSEKNPIIMLSLYGMDFKKVLTWKEFETDLDYVEVVSGEAELLERFKELIEEYKPDILTGYYSDGFDFPYIIKRAAKYKINLDMSLDYSSPVTGRGRSETVDLNGIIHLDILSFIRRVLSRKLKTDSLKLDDVAFELLGEKKEDVDIGKLAEEWDKGSAELSLFCKYNLKDSKLTYELCERILPNIIELVKIVGQTIRAVNRMSFSQIVEWFLIRRSPDFNQIIPSKPGGKLLESRMGSRVQGALVYEPKPGLYENVVVYDFRSLYPTIITSHNISPETLNCDCCKEKSKVPFKDSELWFCKNKEGFFSTILREVITRRMRVKDLLKVAEGKKRILLDARQESLKVISNSFYGYLGFFAARWYSKSCQESVTAYGRHYITKVIDDAKKNGFRVLYSDTDSVFLNLVTKTKEDSLKFCDTINITLPGLMELEYEGFYPRALFVSAKDSELGAKKKYALIDEEDNMTIKGFEMVRRNISFVAKSTQKEILRILLKENNSKKAFDYVRNVVNDLREHKIDIEAVVIRTQLSKPIESYSSIGPHVAVAKKMKAKGQDILPGMKIRYVVVSGREKIRERAKIPEEITQKDYDAEYYINNQVVPAVETILEVFGYEGEEIAQSHQQSKLGSYF